MRKKAPRPRSKPYFCYDENQEFTLLNKKYGGLALFKSVIQVMGKQGAEDPEILDKCNKLNYHFITHNTKDFSSPNPKIRIGIICIGKKKEEEWINKFSKLLKRMSKHKRLYHKTVIIGDTTIIRNRLNDETQIL